MGPSTNTACQRCHGTIVVDYVLLGSAMRCPHCLHDTVPEVPIGGVIPLNGYALTFREFRQLLEPGAERLAIQPFITQWYGATIDSFQGRLAVLGRQGVPIDPLWLHLDIQNDPIRQQALYQVAMSLWR